MRKIGIILVLLGSLFVGCSGSHSGSILIADATKTNDLILVSKYSGIKGDLPSGISLHIHGQINGSAYLFSDNWETTKLTGTVDWKIYHDWFQTNCILHYYADSVRLGALTVDFVFH